MGNEEETKATPEVVKKSETVEVPKKKLEAMLDRLDRLEYAASKGRLDHYDSKIVKDDTKEASVSMMDGKIVTGWKITDDVVEKRNGVWVEMQNIKVYFMDDSSEEMPAKKFWLQHQKKAVRQLSEKKLNTGEIIWEVETIEPGLGEPVKFEIAESFIN